MIFNIQRFSTHDGPGIRTVVFFKGCPLHCPWCENPESQSIEPALMYDPGLCIGCLDCTTAASDGEVAVGESDEAGRRRPVFHRARMGSLERFRRVCPTGALTVTGEQRSVAEIVAEVEKDLAFYGDDGGATLSGGEPFMQPGLVAAVARALGERGIGTAVETSLQAPWSAIEPALPHLSLFLADVKHADPAKYREATGGNLAVVRENFRRLASAGAHVIARVPVVPGFNDSAGEMDAILQFISSFSNIKEVHFLPYHTLGNGKYALLGMDLRMAAVASLPNETMEPYAEAARNIGLVAVIGG
ncbi:MAG TPA: glycyl-radical enzyme activating protein [Spirochaetia bacterium]|nr:glycyl-radical enzyme activating protein [Spirochaetia bacterium]